jgi:16S rRNA (guanine527-N7)-methyltransferase
MSSNGSIPCFKSAEIISEFGLEKRLDAYLDILFEYNKKINLVSRETSRSALVRLAADCLMPFKFSESPVGIFFDIGSGGGFPAIVLLLAFDNLGGVLFERTQKKARFLEEAVGRLSLKGDVRTDNWPPREFGPKNAFNLGTMKLVRLDQKILGGVEAALKPGGRFIYYTSASALAGLKWRGFTLSEFNYYLDDLSQLRTVSIFSKS